MNDVQALASQESLVPSQIYNLSCAAAMASQYLEDESGGGEQKPRNRPRSSCWKGRIWRENSKRR